ncbi:MAG: response regulator transcription factor [Bacteroidales bacterium]|nr:response regulator transcription factor [Bacteroidales bacterium]MBN2757503.1 response regulator transcription factor [Bacteroidales bacterium]
MSKIFLVEDDLSFGSVLKSYLELDDFSVNWINDGLEAVSAFEPNIYDICILDVMLPNLDGFSIAKKIKLIQNDIPLIFLTAKSLKEDFVEGYKIGADDYITKPFDSELLLYKIRAILKRDSSIKEKEQIKFEIGEFYFDYFSRIIKHDDKIKKLSPKEADLLKLLCINKNKILSRSEALLKIWGDDNYFTTRSMDVYITKLRKYLKDDKLIEIENIHSSGFRLKA